MPDCIECGSYTKFEEGLCLDCYKKQKQGAWVDGVIKGRIAETMIEELFKALGFQVYRYGMENTIPGITELLQGVKSEVAQNIKRMPDLVVFKDNKAHFIEVKFRKNGNWSLNNVAGKESYPFQNALFVLVSKKHIKCISFKELLAGEEITEKSRNYLGSRKEFDADKDVIVDFCKYAIKFYETVE